MIIFLVILIENLRKIVDWKCLGGTKKMCSLLQFGVEKRTANYKQFGFAP